MNINIAIDGPSAAGKSTIARKLAKRLNYRYLDTGAMYRCVALKATSENIDIQDEESLLLMLKGTVIDFVKQDVFLDGVDVSKEIRTNNISSLASDVSRLKEIRADMVKRQQDIAAKEAGIIMEGRDIGSVVMPNAQLKIFLVASPEVRAKRRYKELLSKDLPSDYLEILKAVQARDLQDSTRTNSPLIKCDDAIEVDTSNLSIKQVCEEIYFLAKERGA